MKDNRQFLRLNHHADIDVVFSNGEVMKSYTQNLSDDGLYIRCPEHPVLKQGERAEIVVLDIEDAIPRPVKIIRVDQGLGFAVQFI